MYSQDYIAGQNNGLIVGMTVGLSADSGAGYEPKIWNDEGEYSYFYLDFLQPISTFSLGMARESIVMLDRGDFVAITHVQRLNSSAFIIFANLNDKSQGLSICGVKNTLLRFQSGDAVPPFSTAFYVAGQGTIFRLAYILDDIKLASPIWDISEISERHYWQQQLAANTGDIIPYDMPSWGISENMSMSYF